MGKTKRKIETIYMDHEQFEGLKQLARITRIPRAVLWREALDDLLKKHGVPKENQRNS
jgi:Ribbon-helix-helix domain